MQDATTAPQQADARYSGQAGALFGLAMKTGLLTLITLGIYRFWAKTRVRRYIWSSIELEDTRFEYTGTGLEKLLGFLIAVVFLAIYLGLIQIILFYFGLTLFSEPDTAEQAIAQIASVYVTLFALMPFIYFAVYRARRYKLARTRWRGIRFGMEKGAWGYAFRAIGYGLLTILTLGLLMPLATFRLERYMTERSWFGDARFTQGGRWQGLYPAMKHIFIAFGILILGGIAGGLEMIVPAVFCGVVGVVWLIIGAVHYSVQSFAYLTDHKVLHGDITFSARPKTGTIVLTYLVGSLAIAVLVGIAFGLLGAIMGAGAFVGGQIGEIAMPGIGAIVLGVAGYLVILVGAEAGSLAMITQPIIAHYVTTLSVHNTAAFAAIAQRQTDTGADAEGFADALDIGGAV